MEGCFSSDLKPFYDRFFELLGEESEVNGKFVVKEVIYHFAMVQFRNTHGFGSGKVEYNEKVFEEIQSEFGRIFEEFAGFCLRKGGDETYINSVMRVWLIDFSEKLGLNDLN